MGKVMRRTVSQAATGSTRDLLVALRDKIAAQIDSEDLYPRDLHALSRQLVEIRREIADLDSAAPTNEVGTAAAVPDERWNAS